MTDHDIAKTARQLRSILASIEAGDLDATTAVRTRLEGAAAALESLVDDDA